MYMALVNPNLFILPLNRRIYLPIFRLIMTCFLATPVTETVHRDNHNIRRVGLKSKVVLGTSVVRFWCFWPKLFTEI